MRSERWRWISHRLAPEIRERHLKQDHGDGAEENEWRRETEVLRLLAQGCSNAEIARELVVSDATAKTHVSNVLAKPASATACRP